jgi:glycerol dehydrogenase-like iron-containing ADH family enzyme
MLAAYFLLIAFLSYPSTMKMGAVYSFASSVNLYQGTRSHIQEYSTLHKNPAHIIIDYSFSNPF